MRNLQAGFQFVPHFLIGMKPLTDQHWYATNRLNITYTSIGYKLEQEISQLFPSSTARKKCNGEIKTKNGITRYRKTRRNDRRIQT